ncbi:MerR family transcriptional regulator [Enterococcus florum]|uniref:MerR family transcriptional regulator n=1 Tax=Enterococcus florum TaxID=2480627 RepID=A0A4P5PIP0_9ENTE|nr:MerR family transcriptional regulator [Enterococcus florum]GCF93233.1 MerR family transcriptional regulator [Enterococcus florum]
MEETNETLYRVGLFSQMNQVTIKALRHYDEKNLLKPSYVDSLNGYRYYSSSQLPVLHQIIALRKIGFSLDEIKRVQAGTEKKTLLSQKKTRVLEEISEKMKELSVIESYLSDSEQLVDYDIIEKSLPEVLVVSMQKTLKSYAELADYMPEMSQEMERLGYETLHPEYCFNVYLDGEYKEEDIHVEICEAVVKECPNDDSFLTLKKLPMVKKAICTLHKGPYDKLPLSYQALIRFVEQNDYEICDMPRESYINGTWNCDSEKDWLTEIQIPVRAK